MPITIVVSPLGRQIENTGEVIRLEVVVPTNDPSFFDLYDRIEIWRSTDKSGGPYYELTADELSPARLPEDAGDPPASPVTGKLVILDGEELMLQINRQEEFAIIFSGSDPFTFAQAADQVIAQGRGLVLAYVASDGRFVLQTTGAGTGHSLSLGLTGGASKLGLELARTVYGRDARPNLIDDTYRYTFDDRLGDESYFYKVRFRNASTDAVSAFSLPFSAGTRIGVSATNLITGVADLVQGDGRPLINQEVQLRSEFNGSLVDGKVMVGTTLSKLTDVDGHVEFTLVRGQKFGVAVAGTSLFRTITVPVDQTKSTFNLFDPDIADQDVFRVQVPELIVAERRTL